MKFAGEKYHVHCTLYTRWRSHWIWALNCPILGPQMSNLTLGFRMSDTGPWNVQYWALECPMLTKNVCLDPQFYIVGVIYMSTRESTENFNQTGFWFCKTLLNKLLCFKQCCGSGLDPVFLGHPDPDPGKYRIRILYPQKDPLLFKFSRYKIV